ncbi:MAG: response regulator [Magnetococcales bacterium]|nr:response regulator [Magnetococcales bacterium]
MTLLGYQVVTSQRGREALRLVSQDPTRFVAVITDQAMPQMTGSELAKALKAIRPELPIILCTGLGSSLPEPEPDPSIDKILPKPASMKHLAEALTRLLEKSPGAIQ